MHGSNLIPKTKATIAGFPEEWNVIQFPLLKPHLSSNVEDGGHRKTVKAKNKNNKNVFYGRSRGFLQEGTN